VNRIVTTFVAAMIMAL
jgi:hypothetical protein